MVAEFLMAVGIGLVVALMASFATKREALVGASIAWAIPAVVGGYFGADQEMLIRFLVAATVGTIIGFIWGRRAHPANQEK